VVSGRAPSSNVIRRGSCSATCSVRQLNHSSVDEWFANGGAGDRGGWDDHGKDITTQSSNAPSLRIHPQPLRH
jgi:hypothetical protein